MTTTTSEFRIQSDTKFAEKLNVLAQDAKARIQHQNNVIKIRRTEHELDNILHRIQTIAYEDGATSFRWIKDDNLNVNYLVNRLRKDFGFKVTDTKVGGGINISWDFSK